MNAPVPAVIISVILALTLVSFLLGLIMNQTKSVLLLIILHFAVKTNMPTIAVTLTLVIIVTLIWNKFYLAKKLVV